MCNIIIPDIFSSHGTFLTVIWQVYTCHMTYQCHMTWIYVVYTCHIICNVIKIILCGRIRTLCILLETPKIFGKGSLKSARSCCIGMDSRAIAAKKRYVDTGITMSYVRYMIYIWNEYYKIIGSISKNYIWHIQKLWVDYWKIINGISKNYEWIIQNLYMAYPKIKWAGATLSVLSSWQCHLHNSI